MISNDTNIFYINRSSIAPTIISPKSDSHWSSSRNISFVWRYNGADLQYSYQIEVIKPNFDIDERSDITTVLEDIDNSNFEKYTKTEVSIIQSTNINFSSSFLDEDGIYVWRIRTKGTVANEWSDWSTDGIIRYDSTAPIIKNVSVISKSENSSLASYISDLSSPYIYSKRDVSGTTYLDRHIDRNGLPGVYFYFDYRDNSLNIRCQSGSDASARYYGLISFHKNESDPYQYIGNIQDIVNSYYVSKINKDYTIGPNEIIPISEISGDSDFRKKLFSPVGDLIFSEVYDNTSSNDYEYIPFGFPKIFSDNIYGETEINNHPIGMNPLEETFITSFPFYTRIIEERTYVISGVSSTLKNFIELRYPSPYNDFFMAFDTSFNLLLYGKYSFSDLNTLVDNPYSSGTFTLSNAFNVDEKRVSGTLTKPSDLFSTDDNSLSQRADFVPISVGGTSYYGMILNSKSLYFNVVSDSANDSLIKIYINPKSLVLRDIENSNSGEYPFVEINMSPETDCSNANYTDSLSSSIKLGDVFIGRSRINPKDFNSYEESASSKTILSDPKIIPHYDSSSSSYAFMSNVKTISGWGNSETYFSSDLSSYNASFRFRIPKFKYLPYYYPGLNLVEKRDRDLSGSGSQIQEIGNGIYKFTWGSGNINYTTLLPDVETGDFITINGSSTSSIFEGGPFLITEVSGSYLKYDMGSSNSGLGDSLSDTFNFVDILFAREKIPNILSADPDQNSTTSVIAWDSFDISSARVGENNLDFYLNRDYITESDFIKFSGNSDFLGQKRPYFYNFNYHEDYSIGRVLNIRNMGWVFLLKDYKNLGYASVSHGWSEDEIHFNQLDSGLFSICSLTFDDSNYKTSFHLKDFSNLLFRDSLRFDLSSNLLTSEISTEKIEPSSALSGRTFVWDDYSVLDSDITKSDNSTYPKSLSSSSNGPIWVFNKADFTSESNFIGLKNYLVDIDVSDIGYYGSSSGQQSSGWISSPKNIFGGYYINVFDSSDSIDRKIISEKIQRQISAYDEDDETTTVRGELAYTGTITSFESDDVGTDITGKLCGDAFSIGNIFGNVVLSSTGKARFFFDLDEDLSGIDSVKYFQSNISVENYGVISKTTNIVSIGESGNFESSEIEIQKINREYYDLSSPSSSNTERALSFVKVSRSPIPLVDYYLDNNGQTSSTSTPDYLDVPSDSDYGTKRFYIDIDVNGTGYILFYFKVTDKSGNESDLYMVPLYVESSSDSTQTIQDVYVSVDDNLLLDKTEKTLNGSSYFYYSNNLPTDFTSQRPININDIVVQDGDDYTTYSNKSNLLIGFSDNYGLSYNVFSPFDSVRKWKFNQPIPIRLKSNDISERGPDWYLDPNDIRHYTPDSDYDFLYGTGVSSNNNIVGSHSYHIPANNTSEGVTLIGFVDESYPKVGRFNPYINKIYQNRDEFVGKYISLGSNLDLSYKILHIFKSSNLPSIKRWNSSGNQTDDFAADADGSTSSPREKIWIVVDDPDSSCAMILSRKFQYISSSDDRYYIKSNTGWREDPSKEYSESNYVSNFGYYNDESDIPSATNSSVNSTLGMSSNESVPDLSDRAEDVLYIDPSRFDNSNSGISTNEGWITQIFQGYDINNTSSSIKSIVRDGRLKNNQLIGMKVYNKLVFGESYDVEATISNLIYSGGVTKILLSDSSIDYTMKGLDFSIYNNSSEVTIPTTSSISLISYDGHYLEISGNLQSVLESDGVVIDGTTGEIDSSYTCKLKITISPLDSTDLVTGSNFSQGWWPSVGGLLVPPAGYKLGSVSSSDSSWARELVNFVSISNGSFYIAESGYYRFKIEIDSLSYADLCIDYMDATTIVKSVVNIDGTYTSVNVGGIFDDDDEEKQFYLNKGWHSIRFRYGSKYSTSISSYKNYARVLYSKPDWSISGASTTTYYYVPMIGSNDSEMNFISRGYRTVFGKIMDEEYNEYPSYPDFSEISNASSTNSKEIRAIAGIRETLESEGSSQIAYKKILKITDDGSNSPTKYDSLPQDIGLTFAGGVYEIASATYISNIYDGGSDFRFWRNISWTLSPGNQPSGTTVSFYIKTGSSEEEIQSKKWNNIGTTTSENIIDPITSPGEDLTAFSQFTSSGGEITLNRYIQFKMVLTSTVRGVTPTINDVTISYSKRNTVNFFTTTFDLSSNIVRMILTYNGDIPVSSSGIALSEIQFGICTTEDSDGKVITNFDEYTSIPVNEAFSLSQLGVQENDKFRIGIKFVSTEDSIPTVDEFGAMWQTDGDNDKTTDLVDRVDNS